MELWEWETRSARRCIQSLDFQPCAGCCASAFVFPRHTAACAHIDACVCYWCWCTLSRALAPCWRMRCLEDECSAGCWDRLMMRWHAQALCTPSAHSHDSCMLPLLSCKRVCQLLACPQVPAAAAWLLRLLRLSHGSYGCLMAACEVASSTGSNFMVKAANWKNP